MSEINTIVYNLQNRMITAANETEVRDRFCNELRPIYNLDFRYERGRSDARLNNVIFEFKDKGLFRGSIHSAKFKEAYKQLTELYIPRQSKEEGKPKHDYIGIAIDGLNYAFVFYEKNGNHRHTALTPLDQEGIYPLIVTINNDKRRAFSVENILEDFGSDSYLSRSLLSELYKHLNQCLDNSSQNKTKMLFEEWQKLFSQAASLGLISQAKLDTYLSRSGFSQPYNYTRFLFVLHTYNALLLKLIAAEVVTTIRYKHYSGFASEVSSFSLALMQKMLIERIEHATVFNENNIRNFIEGTFFSWYIEDAPITLLTEIRKMLAQLGLYIFPTTREERIRDVVKLVYENLVPEGLRKNIGEFYTPDWLVNFTLDAAGYKGEDTLCKRLLDPCCGSGNFLIHSIARIKSEASDKNLSNSQILALILNNVIGFDLNPLAVLSARLNYLLSVLDILTPFDEIEIPVYMADAVYAPVREDTSEVPIRTYQIGTMMQSIDIRLPEELVQSKLLFGKMLSAIESNVEFDEDTEYFFEEMRRDQALKMAIDANPKWKPFLTRMYEKIREMERKKWDRIWCRVIRNYFASVTLGKVDFIVGNPPWVRWSDLPEDYRQRIKPTCVQYDIFSKTPFFGGNELDISGMIAYTVTDRWLNMGGVLCFVITQIHFQAPSSEGFRSFTLPDKTPLKVLQVHDLSEVRPFPKLSNKTAVFSWRVGEKTKCSVKQIC